MCKGQGGEGGGAANIPGGGGKNAQFGWEKCGKNSMSLGERRKTEKNSLVLDGKKGGKTQKK